MKPFKKAFAIALISSALMVSGAVAVQAHPKEEDKSRFEKVLIQHGLADSKHPVHIKITSQGLWINENRLSGLAEKEIRDQFYKLNSAVTIPADYTVYLPGVPIPDTQYAHISVSGRFVQQHSISAETN